MARILLLTGYLISHYPQPPSFQNWSRYFEGVVCPHLSTLPLIIFAVLWAFPPFTTHFVRKVAR